MDPNTTDQNQQAAQPDITPPQPPAAPEQSMPPLPQAVQPAGYAPATVPQPGKSKKGLIIGLAVGIPVLFIALAFLLLGLFVLPRLQSAGLAKAFMADITSGDVDAAVKAANDESSRSFLTSASAKLKGNSYASSASEYNAKGDSYYLFTLSGGDYKSARVIVAKENGKRVVNSFVYDTQTLALKPGATSTSNSNSSSTTETGGCFAPSDYSTALGYDNTLTFNETSPYVTNVHFLADSLEYDGSYQDEFLKTVAEIVSTNPGKDYTVRLYGSTATTAASDKSFANQRADKVKQSLVAKGLAESKVVIDPAQNVDDAGGATSEVAKQAARVVVVKFIPACTTDTASTTTGR